MKFKCPVDYDINNCSSKEYGLTCNTCFHILEDQNKKDSFKQEYLGKLYESSECYSGAYELWIDYEYNCELFDRGICHGGLDSQGFTKPANTHELRAINQNANYLRVKVWMRAKELGIFDFKDFNDARRDVNRLTWKGIQEEYHRLSN